MYAGLGGMGGARMSNTANPMWVLEQGRHGGRASHGPHKDPKGSVSFVNSSPGGFCSVQL